MKATIISTLALLLLVGLSPGGLCQVSQTGVIFLMIAPGARAGGMGECFAAISDDATATHWNPAGLGRYPLSPAFLEFKLEAEGEIRQIAILKNNLPENNYLRYDIWALVGERLARWNGEKWLFGEDYPVRSGESLEDIAERFTGTDDREARQHMAKKIAEANTTIPFEDLELLEQRILEKVPENYYYLEEIKMGLESLKRSWGELTLDAGELQLLKRSVEDYLADDSLSSLELDKLAFGVDKPVTTQMPEEVKIPFNLVLPPRINCLASDFKDYLYLGTPEGLFRYDRRRWKTFTVESDSLPSNYVTAVAAGEKKSLWLGTDSGLARFDGSKWTLYTTEEELPDNYITALRLHKKRGLWIGTKAGIAYFDGREIKAHLNYPVRVGDDFEKIASRFLGSKHGAEIATAAAIISEYNELADSDSLYPGMQIKIPYNIAFSGEVASLALDKKENLWIGTDSGVWSFHKSSWRRHGYRLYTAEGGESLLEVAQRFVGTKKPERALRLAGLIASYNKIDDNPLQAGEQLYVYANTAGAQVYDLERVGGEILVGTEYGTIKHDGKRWGRY
ncbi:MAG: LysM peptidoglycan-binding domain-containing protein, partial [Candidatus Zixiibacteriota bacterium]